MPPYDELLDSGRTCRAYVILWLEMTDSTKAISQDIRAKNVSVHSDFPVSQVNLRTHVQVLLSDHTGATYEHAMDVAYMNINPWMIPLMRGEAQARAIAALKRAGR